MPNDFAHLTPAEALNASQAVTSKVTSAPNAYGFSQAQIDFLEQHHDALTAAIAAQHNAAIAARAATLTKKIELAALASGLRTLAGMATANFAVTDEMLVAIGFAPRRSGGVRPQSLPAPTGLTAEAFADGTVKLKWNRNGNTPSTVFVVETSDDGLSWSVFKATTRASFLAEGFAPGAATWFRVSATRANLASPVCAAAAIYAPGAPASVQLRVA